MKVILIALYLMMYCIHANAQNNKSINNKMYINSGGHANPLIYLNGSIFKKELYSINPDTIGVIFAVGDSSYVYRTYGSGRDTSLIHKYLGIQRNKGLVFIYTKNKVEDISQNQFHQYLKNEKGRILFKINNEPLTDNYHKINTLKIQMIKDFTLKHWDTGITDTFTLFVIEEKR